MTLPAYNDVSYTRGLGILFHDARFPVNAGDALYAASPRAALHNFRNLEEPRQHARRCPKEKIPAWHEVHVRSQRGHRRADRLRQQVALAASGGEVP
jgi:hypothetical protein